MEYDKVRHMKFLLFFIVSLFCLSSLSAQDVKYKRVSYPDLSSLMWKYKKYETNNIKAIDNYASIHHCNLYKKYVGNDFAWQRIREGIKRDIEYYASDYSSRFEINAVIPIDRYDFEKSTLVIDSEFSLDNAGAIQIPIIFDEKYSKCLSRETVLFFPSNIKFKADNKFSLKDIPLISSKAQDLLKRISRYKYEDLETKRAISLKFQISIDGVKKVDFEKVRSELIFQGQLDAIIFYEDPEMTKEIYRKSFKDLNS